MAHPRYSRSFSLTYCFAGVVPILWLLSCFPKSSAGQELPEDFFSKKIKPVLEAQCVKCHSGEEPEGDLNLTSRAGLTKGGESGAAVDKDAPGESALISAVKYEDYEMPPSGRLPDEQIALIERWVKSGAPWPNDQVIKAPEQHATPKVNEETLAFWSFKALKRPEVPDLGVSDSPIDQFVATRLAEASLKSNVRADRQTLIRRAYYDLTGLPPSPQQVADFVADPDEKAFEKLIDQLLESPHYGEKWGRHWLDLVRFAETNSYERDATKPHAWRYRDYVIESFNQDKPYDVFIRQQIAGDEMSPWKREQIIATGFLRLGIWDDEPADTEQALYDDLDDIMGTTAQVFLGLTINCARCHDHKLDPISQRDYYSMLSFFAGMHRFGGPGRSGRNFKFATASISPPAEREAQVKEKQKHQEKIDGIKNEMREIEKRVKQVLVGGQIDDFKHEQNRLPIIRKLAPEKVTKEDHVTYAKLRKQWKDLEKNPPKSAEMALAVTTLGTKVRDIAILARGNPHAPTDRVTPTFLEILGGTEAKIELPEHGNSSGRRLALANWIATPENPLTARVMANRIWQHHFGRGIVTSANNFGLQGDPPTHPELIDWLACELIDGGWKLKSLHRKIMLSQTWQQSSASQSSAIAKDPENKLLWRYNMRRLTAEEIRDSLLAANETLNTKMSGPSIYTKIPQEVLAGQSRPGSGWGKSSPEEAARRSVYIFAKRSLIDPLIANFDGADTDFTCPVRFETTLPTQCLSFVNSEFIHTQAQLLADASTKHGESQRDQVAWIIERVTQRPAEETEIKKGLELIKSLMSEPEMNDQKALKYFAVVALNMNEFIYID